MKTAKILKQLHCDIGMIEQAAGLGIDEIAALYNGLLPGIITYKDKLPLLDELKKKNRRNNTVQQQGAAVMQYPSLQSMAHALCHKNPIRRHYPAR